MYPENVPKKYVFFAVLAAIFYAVSTPVSKIILCKIPSTLMAALLYLGAGFGMLIIQLLRSKLDQKSTERHLTAKQLPYIAAMVLLDIAAPILLMAGLSRTTAANTSLLNNFEIVATAIIALTIFKEAISKRLWLAIALITLSSIILSFEDISSLSFSIGSVFVLLACMCWGLENNCTRMLSVSNPLEIVIIKGFGSGTGSLIIALFLHQKAKPLIYIAASLLLGFISYGLSICFYVYAQRGLGAAKTSAYYAISPFIAVLFSFILFREKPGLSFIIALVIMAAGAYFASTDGNKNKIKIRSEVSHGDTNSKR